MRLRILRRHINEGKPGLTQLCPVALALKERFPEARVVWVLTSYSKVDSVDYLHKPDAIDFINNFDNIKDTVSPQTITLG